MEFALILKVIRNPIVVGCVIACVAIAGAAYKVMITRGELVKEQRLTASLQIKLTEQAAAIALMEASYTAQQEKITLAAQTAKDMRITADRILKRISASQAVSLRESLLEGIND